VSFARIQSRAKVLEFSRTGGAGLFEIKKKFEK